MAKSAILLQNIKKSAILTPEECKQRQGFRLLWSTKWDPNKPSELDNLDSENSTDSENETNPVSNLQTNENDKIIKK